MLLRPLIWPIVCLFAMLTSACGSDDDDDTPATPTTNLTYSDVATFINQHCASSGCHNAATKSGNVDLSTHAGVQASAAASAAAISNGTMPQSGSAERSSFDDEASGKANLLEYLNAGAPE